MMDIKDHGLWQRYTPAKLPQGAPASAMFVRRESDGVDWYTYVNSGDNFAEDTIKLTLHNGVVSTATTDPTALFPDNATVLEISGVASDDPLKQFGRKTYDATRKTFRDPEESFTSPMDEILRRLKDLEDRKA